VGPQASKLTSLGGWVGGPASRQARAARFKRAGERAAKRRTTYD